MDIFDVARSQTQFGVSLKPPFFRLPGDTNEDPSVDIFDVKAIQLNFGKTEDATLADGDCDADGDVDLFDVAIVQRYYGRSIRPSGMASAAPSAEAVDKATSEPLPSAMPSAVDDLAQAIAMARVSRPTTGTASPARAAAADGASASWASVDRRHARRSSAYAVSRPMQPLAVRHAVENASWESAVDRLLEADELELAR